MAKLLLTVQSLDLGGMEKIVSELALGLKARGHEVCVVGVYGAGPHAQRLQEGGVKVHTGLAHRRFDPLAPSRLRRICRKEHFDFVIAAESSAMYAPFVALRACRSLGIPYVRWSHAMPDFPLSAAGRVIQRLLTAAGNTMVASTRTHARAMTKYWKIPASRITVIWNGQPLPPRRTPAASAAVRSELGIGTDRFVIGMVAGFRRIKRHEVLIRAMRQVVNRFGHVHLLLVGDGVMRPESERLVAELDLGSHATVTGTVTDAMRLYAAMDVHVLCTYPAETFPLSVMEAMGAGVVPVSTRVGSMPELIADGRTGVLVQPEAPAMLADAIADLVEDRPKLQRLADAAREFAVTHFSLDAMVDSFVNLLGVTGPAS